jgi:hypothetical protein
MAVSVSSYATGTGTGTLSTFVGLLPPGGTALFQTTGTNPNYVGLGTNVTSSNGIYCPNGTQMPYPLYLPLTAQPASLYAVSTTGASVLQVTITTTT